MEIGSSGSLSSASASNAAEVKVFNSQRKQLEAVVGKILQGVAEAGARIQSQTGQRLNVVA